LQQVVLNHVARGAVVVVIGQPLAHAFRFGDGDLDVIDRKAVPQRLEEDVAEPERQQVLHRLLAEIVVDAEGARLREDFGHRRIDHAGGLQIAPDRLLQHHRAVGGGQPGGREPSADRGVKVGRDREVETPAPIARR
jgi:hypothetical protein